jgi:hypothetical protein
MRFETLFVVAAILWSGAEAITCWHVDGDALCASRCAGGSSYINCAASRVRFPPLLYLMAGWVAESEPILQIFSVGISSMDTAPAAAAVAMANK